MKIAPLFFALLLLIKPGQAQVIITVAGNGSIGYSGDGGTATAAQFDNPFGVAADNNGNIYIADAFNNVIRKVNSSGVITTFAGTGVFGYSGDGGPATAAQLSRPFNVSVDNNNNVYFTDLSEKVIRKVTPAGIINTITGNLPLGYSGDGGPLIQARFGSIAGVSFDNAGNMYITDFGNSVIRKVNSAGIISTFAGTGTPGFSGDGGPATSANIRTQAPVAVDRNNNNVYIPDPIDNRIRVVYPSGMIGTYAGAGTPGYSGDGGPALAATMNSPWHITIDPSGNLYVVDYYNRVIRKIDVNGIISTFAGNGTPGYSGDGGPAIQAQVNDLCEIACDNATGDIYVVQRTSQVVRKITGCLPPTITQQTTSVSLCNAGNAQFNVNATNATGFQWEVNNGTGWSVLSNDATYAGVQTNTLAITNAGLSMNGYQFRCKVTNACGSVFSMTGTLTLTTPSIPAVSILESANTICAGTNVTFTATPINAGTAPTYQWKKNGINTGSNTQAYTDNSLANGDIITCVLTSSNSCAVPNPVTSNTITMIVKPLLTAALTITSSANDICAATLLTFTAVPVNEGSSPSYQWKKNGVNVGTSSLTYTDNSLNDGDQITCVLTASGCLTSTTAASNSISMHVFPTPVATLDKTASICEGSSRTFDAGTHASYSWSDASTGQYLTVTAPGTYYVTVYDNNGCKGTDTSRITLLAPLPNHFLPQDIAICPYEHPVIKPLQTFTGYLWNNSSASNSIEITAPGIYWLDAKTQYNCIGRDSIVVTPKECPNGFYMPTGFTPNNDGKNDLCHPLVYGNVIQFHFSIYNRWGQKVFDTKDIGKGWNGSINGLPIDTGVFAWTCSYQFEGQEKMFAKGTVILIR